MHVCLAGRGAGTVRKLGWYSYRKFKGLASTVEGLGATGLVYVKFRVPSLIHSRPTTCITILTRNSWQSLVLARSASQYRPLASIVAINYCAAI